MMFDLHNPIDRVRFERKVAKCISAGGIVELTERGALCTEEAGQAVQIGGIYAQFVRTDEGGDVAVAGQVEGVVRPRCGVRPAGA